MSEQFLELVESLSLIEQDLTVPKNVRTKIKNAMAALQEKSEDSKIMANRALQQLDEISDDPNIPGYVRPQIWNVVSMLEGF